MKKRNLKERLDAGPVICAEGFLFEIEKRGYMSSGEFVPMVSLENPEALENLHRDFQHAGSDIVQAFTYNGHREKMRVIGKEELLEQLKLNTVSCKDVSFRIFGLSLAAINTILSIVLSVIFIRLFMNYGKN